MAGLFSKVARFAASPQGQRAIAKARRAASDPKNRAKINEMVAKVQRKGGQPRAADRRSAPARSCRDGPSAGPDLGWRA